MHLINKILRLMTLNILTRVRRDCLSLNNLSPPRMSNSMFFILLKLLQENLNG